MEDIEKYQHLLLMLLLLLVTAACEKGPEPMTPLEIVTQDWNVDDVVVDNSSQGSQNVTVDFEEGGQYTLRIPTLDRLGTSGSWRFSNDQTVIILNDGSQEVIAEIVSISEEQMILEFDFENYKGDITTYRITLSS